MNEPATPKTSARHIQPSDAADVRLHGRWLRLARGIWLAIVIFTLALFVGSLPAYYTLLQTPCGSSRFPCGNLTGGLSAAGLRELQAAGFSTSAHAAYIIALTVAVALIWVAIGLVVFWRRSDDWVALLGALALLVTLPGQTGGAVTALADSYPVWTASVAAASFLSTVVGILFFALFPSGRFAPRWMRWVIVLFLIFSVFDTLPPADSPLNLTNWPLLNTVGNLGTFAALIFSQIYRYRRASNAVQRQQVKWAVFGISLSLVLVIGVWIATIAFTTGTGPQVLQDELLSDTAWLLAFLPIPIFFGIAILRNRLWDIDTLINKALVYGVLTGLLGALYAGLIIGLESLAGLFAGQTATNPLILVVSTLAIAALFQPVRKRIQRVIDRRFYRHKYDAEKTLEAFSASLRNEVDMEQLRVHLLMVVQETMQPAHASLWLRQPTGRPHQPEPQTS